MAWLKRHWVLAIGGLAALLLLGAGTWYLLGNITQNDTVATELDVQKHALDELYAKDPFPHRTNIDAAKRETQKVHALITQARQSFTPVPYEKVTDLAFKTLLDNTIDDLHKKAEKASVGLPNKGYEFSFAAQKSGLKFSPAIFPRINMQLAEVKAICNILFDAKINRLENVRRVRVSADDPPGSADYLDGRFDVTNTLTGAVLSPYQVQFQCFSSELAAAMEGLYKSPHGLLAKAVLVEAIPPQPGPPQAVAAPPPVNQFNRSNRLARPLPQSAAPRDGLDTILTERLLKVILLIEVVKPGTESGTPKRRR